MKNDISKLPAWAQSEIKRLQADNKHYQEKIDEMMGVSDAETNTYIWGGMEHKPMPKDTAIVFTIEGKGQFTVMVKREGLDINFNSLAGHKMAILPHVSNAITLACIED